MIDKDRQEQLRELAVILTSIISAAVTLETTTVIEDGELVSDMLYALKNRLINREITWSLTAEEMTFFHRIEKRLSDAQAEALAFYDE